MMEPTNVFEFCSEPSAKKWLHIWTPFGVGVLLALMLKMMPKIGEGKSLANFKGTVLQTVTSIMILVGTAALFYQESFQCASLLSCASYLPTPFTLYALTKWISFMVHIFFMVKTLLDWTAGVSTYVGMVSAIINTALFVEDVMVLITQHHLFAFQYLFLINFQCPDVKWFFRIICDAVLPKHKVLLVFVGKLYWVTLLLAGSLRTAEEWKTNDDFIPDSEDSQTQMLSAWSYVYWTVITISTVGYGDLTPSTPAGQFVIMVTIVIFLVWFGNLTSDLYDYLELFVKNRSINPSRHIIVGCKTKDQLESFLTAGEKAQNIIVLVDSKDTELLNTVNELGLEAIDGSDTKKAVVDIMCPGQPQDLLYFLHDPTLNPEESKKHILDIVQALRENGCKATVLQEIAPVLKTDFPFPTLYNAVFGSPSN